jgi:TIR domain
MNHGHSPGAGQPETPKLPHAVFISYSNQDKVTADGVCAALEADSVSCWIAPRDVAGGRPYSGDLLTNLSNACGVGRSVLIVGDDSLLML